LADKGWSFASIEHGSRSSAATAYLKPAMVRPNLDVVINAQATKLVKTGHSKGVPSFRAVEVVEHEGGKWSDLPKTNLQS